MSAPGPLHELVSWPRVERPVLVVALEGWIDAGYGAAGAAAALLEGLSDERVVARFDSDELLDHRARRPVLHIVDGVNVGLTWPEIQLRHATSPGGTDVLLLTGPEPDHAWRRFSTEVAHLAVRMDVRIVALLGAFPAPVPHTRPVRVVSTATTAELAASVGFLPGAIDVPAGVQGALEVAFSQAGVPATGLWARVPHYVAGMAYPPASVALLEALAGLTGIDVDLAGLRGASATALERVAALIAANDEHRAMVAQLEQQLDATEGTGEGAAAAGGGFASMADDLPSGDELAAELERYLRSTGDPDGPDRDPPDDPPGS